MAQPDTTFSDHDPRYHTANIKGLLSELAHHLRQDINKISEPQAQELFETTAEVLQGLHKAFERYEKRAGKASVSH